MARRTEAGVAISGVLWTCSDPETWDAGQWDLCYRSRAEGRSPRGWYLGGDGMDHVAWAARRLDDALKVATLLILGEWHRTGLRDRTGRPFWRNAATGAERAQDDLTAELEVT